MNDNLARMYQESQRQMREALEAVEWVTQDESGDRFCPWCGGKHPEDFERDVFDPNHWPGNEGQHKGHKPDCQRQQALGLSTNTDASAES